eukprot:CAMPEP_0119009844 /NCGR_PEP_ID=MMETSP1176-20130426/4633_1 /TAXON_ID=265551 /ORGANISM="Synedropsis recta cf, Strain CCMP1620" /LENGTH=491 /DNA_ID=CAMNT_0006962423 /DNA_START=277 /DNA_END=1750 /DNA_ORIENTATION=+
MEGQKRHSKTGEIKVAGLSNKRAKQSDPRLAWAMFHSICAMYRDAKKSRDQFFRDATEQYKDAVEDDILGPKAVRPNIPETASETTANTATPTTEQLQIEATATELLQIQASQFGETVDKGLTIRRAPMIVTREEMLTSLAKLRAIPDDFADIQPRADQVWNCDEVGIDPNGKWTKIVCTFKWCMTEKIWKTQTGERAPFWCSFLFFSRADGQSFIAPTVIHQGAEMSADFLLNLPGNWIVHASPSGYMDRDGWYKTIHNFANLSGASKSNKQFLYFDGHDSHWDADALELMDTKHVQSFFLKSGDSENDQPNDNGPNACVKSCYNDAKRDVEPVHDPIGTGDTESFCGHKDPSSSTTKCRQRPSLSCIHCLPTMCVEPTVIMQAKKCSNRNLLIRAAAYDIVRASLVVPVQEMKRITQEHAVAKNIKLGSSEVQQESRSNPDSSRGLYVTAELRAKARAATDLKLAYQYLGGKVANLPNGKKETYVSLLT